MSTTRNNSLDFSAPEAQAGFRLQRFEMLNWGTFHRHVWHVAPGGDNALLTGDIGSGKSTLVDALTTLLVPSQKITYNKAAGAEGRERSQTSYVRGYYKSEKDADSLNAKAVALRDHSSYSVLLGLFHNAGYDQWVTLAQIFWSKPGQQHPERLYLVADRPLAIAADFSGFGGDIQQLRKRLRQDRGVMLFDSFVQYAAEFRRRMGIENEQALALFYQTVSMKSVGNLTDFVRDHMLEPPPVEARVETLCREFENLNQAHDAVVKARRQIEMLTPLVQTCDRLAEVEHAGEHLRACRDALRPYFDGIKAGLLTERIERRSQDLERIDDRVRRAREALADLRGQEADVRRAIDDQGGRRLADIDREVERLTQERARRQQQAERYQALCRAQDFDATLEESPFHAVREHGGARRAALEQAQAQLEEQQVDLAVQKQQLTQAHAQLSAELKSLRARKTNLPARSLALRAQVCDALEIPDNELPFAGELMQVRAEESRWEGALERVLHNFGVSLLVPERHYARVAHYVDVTDLKARLVYFRVGAQVRPAVQIPAPDALVHKLDIKPDSEFYPWLERELGARFDYACCADFEAFQRRPKALSLNGQIKSGGERHEKDDRHALTDRTRYVLGWSNAEKIRALENNEVRLHHDMLALLSALHKTELDKKHRQAARDQVLELLRFERLSEIVWAPLATQVEILVEEKRRIEHGSDRLRELQARLQEVCTSVANDEHMLQKQLQDRGSQAAKLEADQAALHGAQASLASWPGAARELLQPALQGMQREALGEKNVNIEGCESRQQDMREWLQDRIDAEDRKAKRMTEDIIQRMQQYKTGFPVETREADVALQAVGEYRAMLERLQREDLPRHEQRFKTMLNENTINDIALFRSQLDKEREEIERRIEKINVSLSAIDYNAGTYIKLVGDRNPDAEIRTFQEDLRACLGDALAARQDDLYTEDKFSQVKALIDRFKGREGTTELDRRWTRKVTDVRNWFVFSASERWRADDSEREHYSDSAGKSGGQKEKLAYTILASALGYQFGLAWGETRSRSFRFVMIDEAFGRGSDDSARYALELFKKLNLQLLIVTPLQKIHVIEDYVRTVNFVHNQDGCNSMLRNLSIEAYREEKVAYQTQHAVDHV